MSAPQVILQKYLSELHEQFIHLPEFQLFSTHFLTKFKDGTKYNHLYLQKSDKSKTVTNAIYSYFKKFTVSQLPNFLFVTLAKYFTIDKMNIDFSDVVDLPDQQASYFKYNINGFIAM